MFRSGKSSRFIPGARSPRRSPLLEIAAEVNWLIFVGFVIVLAAALYATTLPQYVGIATFAFVLIGWLFSLTLHEFGHAAVAFLNGDRSESTRRYLSGNPLLYIHPVLSVLLPLLFVLLGGIGLPGGAVYLQQGYIRDRWRQSVISLAGPAANLVVLVVLAVIFRAGTTAGFLGDAGAGAIAFLAFLQVSAIVLNLIPIPGLDGYGAIEPYLSYQTRRQFEAIRPYGFILVFVIFYLPLLNQVFFNVVDAGLSLTGIDPGAFFLGYVNFRFWVR